MPGLSLAPFVLKRPWLQSMIKPLSNWYNNSAGYRQLGLRYDDLIPEDSEVVQAALKRLSPKESYDRVYRIRRATQCSITHKLLPKAQWTKEEEDVRYLAPLLEQIQAEIKEKEKLDSLEVTKSH